MYDTRHPKLVLCDNLEQWGGEGVGRGVQEGGDTVHLQLSHTDV